MRRERLLFALALVFGGCKGCEKPAADPAQFIGRTPESVVVEIPRVGALPELLPAITDRLGRIGNPADVERVKAEAARILGFDPMTKDGLERAGIRADGAAAIEFDLARTAPRLAVLPVASEARLGDALQKLGATLAPIKRTAVEDHDGQKVTVLYAAFGPSEVPLIAYSLKSGLAIIGTKIETVTAALALTTENNLVGLDEYKALDQSIGKRTLRVMAPSIGGFLDEVVNTLWSFKLEEGRPRFVSPVKSFGVGLDVGPTSLALEGRVRLTPVGLDRVNKVAKSKGPLPPAARALASADPVLFVDGALDAQALIAAAEAEQPEIKDIVDKIDDIVRSRSGLELRGKVLPSLTGRGVVAMGVNDLAGVTDLRALADDPAKALWTAVGIGLSAPLGDLGPALKSVADAQGLGLETRKVGTRDVLDVSRTRGDQKVTLLEIATDPDALFVANDPKVTDRALGAAQPPADPLGAEAGLVVVLETRPLLERLKGLDPRKLAEGAQAALLAAMISKAELAVSQLVAARLELRPEPAGVIVRLKADLSAGATK